MSATVQLNLLEEKGAIPVHCAICGGELVPRLSLRNLEGAVPDGIVFACSPDPANANYIVTDSEVYVARGDRNVFTRLSALKGNNPFCVEDVWNTDKAGVIIKGNCGLYIGDTKHMNFDLGEGFSCGIMRNGRLIGGDMTDGYRLRWSGPSGVRDWTKGLFGCGYVDLDTDRGKITDVVSFKEKLVIVRTNGLTVMNASGIPENYSILHTDTDAEGIVKGTAKVVSGKLYFCAKGGLYSYNGYTVSKVCHTLEKDVSDPEYAFATSEKYFLACRSASLGRRIIMCFDSAICDSYLIDGDPYAMCGKENVYIYNPKGAFVLSEGGNYVCTFKGVNFSSASEKTVTGIYIDGCADIEISAEGRKRSYPDACGVIRPRIRGKEFTVKVGGNKPVKSIVLRAEVRRGLWRQE